MKLWEALKLLDDKEYPAIKNHTYALIMDSDGTIQISIVDTKVHHTASHLLSSDGWEGVK